MVIRPIISADTAEWLRMRKSLWPHCTGEMHAVEMKQLSGAGDETVFVIDRSNNKLGGFVEVSIRDRVDGSTSARVGYLEGWYVDPDLRGQGFGKELVATAERWAATKGMTEIASDAEFDNVESIKAHKSLGFKETFRLVHFLKPLR